jgi:hypothetical protein
MPRLSATVGWRAKSHIFQRLKFILYEKLR